MKSKEHLKRMYLTLESISKLGQMGDKDTYGMKEGIHKYLKRGREIRKRQWTRRIG